MQHQYLGVKNHFKKFDNNSHKYKHPSHSLDPLISVHLLVKKKSVVRHGPSTNVHLLFSLWSEIVTTARLFRQYQYSLLSQVFQALSLSLLPPLCRGLLKAGGLCGPLPALSSLASSSSPSSTTLASGISASGCSSVSHLIKGEQKENFTNI